MVQIRKYSFIKKVKDITIGGSLGLALLGGISALESCGRKENEEMVTEYTNGVHTYVKETEKGIFKITEEKATDSWDARAVVQYLDGRVDTLNEEEIKHLIKTEVDTTTSAASSATDTTKSQTAYRNHSYFPGLGMLLWYGAMGNLFGRRGGIANPNIYASPDAYNRSRQTTAQLNNSRVTRPASSSRGFFRNSSGGSFRG